MDQKKSGQTALILVVVTMVTVLGIGVASSTQSNLDLKNTVYSSQSEQALACAEAGAEFGLAQISSQDADLSGDWDPTSTNGGSATDQNIANQECLYSYTITKPTGTINIPKLEQNMTQELKYSSSSNTNITFTVTAIDVDANHRGEAGLAVYLYKKDGSNNTSVERKFYYLGNGSTPDDFIDVNSGTFNIDVSSQVKAIRIRAINSDLSINIGNNYPTPTHYFISSTGTAGVVSRTIQVYRFFSQLPGVFDEVIVDY